MDDVVHLTGTGLIRDVHRWVGTLRGRIHLAHVRDGREDAWNLLNTPNQVTFTVQMEL